MSASFFYRLANHVLSQRRRTICVIRLSAIGDTCHALAVIRRIQDNWPDAPITWIIGKTEAQLMADIPEIEFIIFDKSKGRRAYKDVSATGRSNIRHCLVYARVHARQLSVPKRLRTRSTWLRPGARKRLSMAVHQSAYCGGRRRTCAEAMMSFATTIGAEPSRSLGHSS